MVMIRGHVTGRRWRRPDRVCPQWCAGGHHCTAQHGYTGGEHRSAPVVLATPWGKVVATQIEKLGGQPQVSVSATVRLPDGDLAGEVAVEVATAVDQAVTEVLAAAHARAWATVDTHLPLEPAGHTVLEGSWW